MSTKFLLVLACLSLTLGLQAQKQEQKVRVLLLGTFHFDNPGLDVAQFEDANISSAKRQDEILEVVRLLKKFGPDKIFVEQPAASQAALDSRFARYARGQKALGLSELDQLGFRLAKELGHHSLYAVDFRGTDFPFDSLVNSATAARQFELLGFMQRSIDSIQKSFNASLRTRTVKELLLDQNSKATTDFQVGSYFEFLVAGKDGDHIGSYLTSEWWRRNMVIYENVLKRLDGKEKNILVIFGSGHTALLQEMMKYNKKLELVPLAAVLK